MIIKRIMAENLLKYSKLQISDIPRTGQIAVSGANEAGKTAIGETICFALFGRTFSLESEEIARVIRWSEFSGRVLLEFTGTDGNAYAVTRQIDNNGKHTTSLHKAGEPTPIAETVNDVNDAIIKIAGFTYNSFVDSFYLAQREMEMPHAKSDTVKALIGVDRLEKVAADFNAESAEIGEELSELERRAVHCRAEIAEVGLDRAHLGRIEAKREVEVQNARKAENNAREIAQRTESLGLAVKSFAKSSEMFVKSTLRNTYGEWRQRREHVGAGLVAANKAGQESGTEIDRNPFKHTASAVGTFDLGLSEFEKVRDLAGLYRRRLRYLLDDRSDTDETRPEDVTAQLAADAATEKRFSDRRSATIDRCDELQKRRRPLFGFGVFFVEVALLGWIAWIVSLAMPGSTFAGWIKTVMGMSDTARQVVCLLAALVGTSVTAILFVKYRHAGRKLIRLDSELENIEAAAQAARNEINVIESMDDAALPDALAALEKLQNPLLKSAVVAFVDGSGDVLVHPDAMANKLDEIRKFSSQGIRTLKSARDRLVARAESLKADALSHHENTIHLERDIEDERMKWEQVESLEKELTYIEGRIAELCEEQRVRSLGRELIDGACRRIYGRFHPELRRFVSKILPELTAHRYEHLELDDDLKVRVYCNEKNDFVGLAEISNGTHRQLMLCVRLALSQALIASSSKSSQFIFFDEPFVFFDEERMARAIDVLGKISPQITQIWLAAQTFGDPARFDMVIDCDPDSETLIAAGKPKSRRSSKEKQVA